MKGKIRKGYEKWYSKQFARFSISVFDGDEVNIEAETETDYRIKVIGKPVGGWVPKEYVIVIEK